MSRKQKVSIYLRIRLDGKQRYCPAVWESKKRLKDHHCLVADVEEHRPDGVYYLRYRVNGKQVWESVEGVGHNVLNLRAQRLGLRVSCFTKVREEVALRRGQMASDPLAHATCGSRNDPKGSLCQQRPSHPKSSLIRLRFSRNPLHRQMAKRRPSYATNVAKLSPASYHAPRLSVRSRFCRRLQDNGQDHRRSDWQVC
jgi:hypothetical protein